MSVHVFNKKLLEDDQGRSLIQIVTEVGERPPEMSEFWTQVTLMGRDPNGVTVPVRQELVAIQASNVIEAFEKLADTIKSAGPEMVKRAQSEMAQKMLTLPAGALKGDGPNSVAMQKRLRLAQR